MKLEFESIKNQNIFQPEFINFSENGNNVIEFKRQPHASGGIAVVYAPNGTGKSSLAAVLQNEEENEELLFEAVYDGNSVIQPGTRTFHIIGLLVIKSVVM